MPSGNQKILVLPKLKQDSDVKPSDRPGLWDIQPEKAFENVASSLDYQAPGAVKSISSVPTMWARPLLMEMALYNQAHPLHQQVVEQWQGMLAAIALAEIRGFDLKAQLVELESLRKEDFADSLFELLPEEKNTLYKLASKNAWQDIYVFLWNGKPVGMSSPSTLVVPSEEGQWKGLPWWRQENGVWQLSSPQDYLNESEQGLLWCWLENLDDELAKHQGQKGAINIMRGLIGNFQASLRKNENQKLSLSNDSQFFGVPLNRGVLVALNRPVKGAEVPSSVRLIASREKGVKPLLIIDPEIAKQWNIPAQKIGIHDGKTLASLKMQELPNLKTAWQDVILIQSDELFLQEFVFIDQDEALPGVLLPKTSTPLIFNNQRITPLIPLEPILLNYFAPEDLIKKIQFQVRNNEVRVIVDLPLSGNKEPFRIQKDYPLKEENALPQVPVMEVWPNLRAPGWKEYYGFYYDAEHGEDTFQVNFPEVKDANSFQEARGSYQIARMEEFPDHIKCLDSQRKLIGLIALATPLETKPSGSWKVGVDFGTSFTNIYVKSYDIAEPLQLENLILKITDSDITTRRPVLWEYFIPESFIPEDKPLPLSSVLTTKGSKETRIDKIHRLIFDGRIYTPRYREFRPQEGWIKTSLKWSEDNRVFNQLFLKHLGLHISALAAQKDIAEIQWCISYPSAFSRSNCRDYLNEWKELTKELANNTGIKQICPDSVEDEDFSTESLATAQYFRDQEGHRLVKTTCIDIGGGTSDISIWEANKLLHQCSVQLASRDLFSQFLEINPKFIEQKFEINLAEWKGLKGGAFNAKLDVWLRQYADDWLNNRKRFVRNNSDFQGFVRLMTIGIAGLYYYVGILLKVLYREEKYSCEEITDVYVGGNGSRLFNWLAQGEQFSPDDEANDLFSLMLSKGSGFEDDEIIVTTRLSQNPKDEVACGLVLDDTELNKKDNDEAKKKRRKPKEKDFLIAGEGCYVNGDFIDAESRLKKFESDDKLKEFKIPELTNVSRFLYDFHMALIELDIEDIKPLPGYTRKPEIDSNKNFWREVGDELTNLLLEFKGKKFDEIRLEPPFILGLKALLKVLAKQWAGK
jgi:hypothetical protein